MTRRVFCKRLLAVVGAAEGLVARAAEATGQSRVVVIGPRTAAAYEEAFSGIMERLRAAAVETSVIDAREDSAVSEIEKAKATNPKVVIAVGSEAVDLTAGGKWRAPVVSAMTMKAPVRMENLVGSVLLGIPIAVLLGKLKSCFPGKSRIGIPFRPDCGEDRNALRAECAHAGFSVEVADCATAADLVPQLIGLKDRKADFALCLADSTLYNAATIKPLVLASLEQRIPLVGFSASFVRAGAAVGVYADLKGLGRQTAETALRYLATRKPSEPEAPNSVQVGINQRVARLIGLEFHEKEPAEVVVFR